MAMAYTRSIPKTRINFPSFPERARSGRFDYIIVQVLKPSPLWYLNYRVLTIVCCRDPWVWPTPWPLGTYTETPSDAQKYFRVRHKRADCGDLG
jgi:hypothetical protein